MTLEFHDLMVIYPEQTWIEISPREQERIWQMSASQPYSNAAARWTAFVNGLCSNTFISWLKQDLEIQESFGVWPGTAELPSFWEVVNGTALTLGTTRLVLIPSDKSDLSFQIPQEWVDIPNWAAHYYLAVQINLEEHWLRVWGYASHQQIQNRSSYDPIAQTYSLDRGDLIEDLNVLWVAQELCLQKEPKVKPLPRLSETQAKKLLEQLSQKTPYSPRLDVPFTMWAALLASNENRQQLYQQRLLNLDHKEVIHTQSIVHNLSKWFQNIFEADWQSLDTILALREETFGFCLRGDCAMNELCIKRAKIIDLGIPLGVEAVILLVGLSAEKDDKVGIRVQVHPANGEMYLPSNLKLILLSRAGKIVQEVQSRSYDNYIQLKRFKSIMGTSFSIQIAIDSVKHKEDFMIESLV
jgi:hypothetical protein